MVVAFSGGCDSLALLALCARTMDVHCITAVYVNHRLRDEKELHDEIMLNKANCCTLGVKLIIRELDAGEVGALASRRGGGTEEAARILRYRVLEEERQRAGAQFILTAHHLQDQAETILMRIRNGSPSTTLTGIREKDCSRHLARPMLQFSRTELELYNNGLGLAWSTDSSNTDARYSRNAVRNDIMPAIRDIWNGVEDALIRLGEEAAVLSGDETRPDNHGQPALPYDLCGFRGKTASARMSVLFSLWDSVFGGKELSMTLMSRVLDAVAKYEATGKDSTVGAGGGIFTLYHGKLYITDPGQEHVFSSFRSAIIPGVPQTKSLPGGFVLRTAGHAEKYAAACGMDDTLLLRMDSSLFSGEVTLRFAREGDTIRVKGGRKTVGKLLQDMGIPAVMRGRIPVLEDSGGICAVFGSCCGGRDRISCKFRTSLARISFPLYIVSKG